MKFRSPVWKIPDADFISLTEKSNTYTDILAYFGLSSRGSNIKTAKRRISFLNIPFKSKRCNIVSIRARKRPVEELLTKNSNVQAHYLKKRLIKEGIFVEECSECGNSSTWNGKPLSLHLDHIDGNPKNNLLLNIRLLCPNCHSQTDNYCGKANRKPKKLCKKCGKELFQICPSGFCRDCYRKERRKKPPRVPAEELRRLIETRPITQIGKEYGVTDSAVRKWMKKYGLVKKYGVGDWAKLTKTIPIPPKEEIKRLALTEPMKAIADYYKVGEETARKWCKKYNLKKPSPSDWANKRWSVA